MVVDLEKEGEYKMARYTGPICKLCRREGIHLYLKGKRCETKGKCSLERKNYAPPGMPSKRRKKLSEYASQLREKQKVKRYYGILERQFRSYYEFAAKTTGITGELLLQFLEVRLDNVLYRTGFAVSRNQARVLVSQGHIKVNDKKANISSYSLKIGDKIEFKEKAKNLNIIKENIEFSKSSRSVPSWLNVDYDSFQAKIIAFPERSHIDIPVKEQVIVELYSK